MAAGINMILGIWAGLIRIGWNLPATSIAVHHGALMVGGFLTTLVALEKVIPLKKKIAFAVPIISAFSLLMVIPGYFQVGIYFLLAGSIGLLIIHAWYLNLYPRELTMFLMLAGAILLIIGNAMLIDSKFYPATFPWWMGFLLFTITAERLELSRFLPVSKTTKYWLLSFLAFYVIGILLPFHGYGKYLSGFAFILIASWMLRNDVMRIGIKKSGLTKFSAMALLFANLWLLIAGLLMVVPGNNIYSYDMLVHAFFIGYAISMILAHGPIILPGVLGLNVKPFHTILYVWLFFLQASLLLRVVADAWLLLEWRAISGILSTAGILLYFLSLVVLVLRQLNHAKAR